MVPLKSQFDESVELLRQLVLDVSLLCGTRMKAYQRDVETLEMRTRCEGFGFLSKSLPKLGKAIDRSLETHILEMPPGFKPQRNSKIPRLFGDIFRCIYSEDGHLTLDTDYPSVIEFEALRGLRQICYLFYKVEMAYSEDVVDETLKSFIATDSSLPETVDLDQTLLVASQLLEELFAEFDPLDVVPGHGPGAVATGERGNEKYDFKRLYPSVHSLYHYQYYFGVPTEYDDDRSCFSWFTKLTRAGDPCAKVVLVPKDSRGPRLISEEPLEIQWIQQGLGPKIDQWVERHPLTRGMVNFTDQSINQNRALLSSLHRDWATIDLKDASDRVSHALVKAIFPGEPEGSDLLACLDATRSCFTSLPNGETVKLKKFAPMGSRLCFSIEALTFWAILVAEISLASPGKRLATQMVYVYGDDIIVPTPYYDLCVAALERYALRVNDSKSYHKGFFRESCGVDAWYGSDVTPARAKLFPERQHNDRRNRNKYLPHFSSMFNHLFERGYWRAAQVVRRLIEATGFRLPFGTRDSGYPCIHVDDPETAERMNVQSGFKRRWNADLQRLEFYLLTVKTVKKKSPFANGWDRLLKYLTVAGRREGELQTAKEGATSDPCFYEPRHVARLKWRWVSV